MSYHFRHTPTTLDVPNWTVFGCLSIMLFTTVGHSSQVADTCGHYFFFPVFTACDLYLEAVPCFNDTPNVIITMTTPAGEVIKSFHVVFGAMKELRLVDVTKGRYEGIVVRSNEDISVYIHNTSGDSMLVYPIDALARDYEIPRLTSYFPGNSSRNSGKNYHDGALYIFSPFNNTSITIVQLYDAHFKNPLTSISGSSSSFSSTTVKLDAFEIYEYHINTFRRYRLHSADVFAIILMQTSNNFTDNDNLCVHSKLSLMDFVPPYAARGKYFYIAFPKVSDFRLFVMGPVNTTLDITTDLASKEVVLDQSGDSITEVNKTSSAWMTASHPVSIYIKITLCINETVPLSKMCAQNGFFLPSVEQYFTCQGNLSSQGCSCVCPSVFQREINPKTFQTYRNSSKPRPTTIYPLLVGDLFDVTTSILDSIEYKDSDDVVVTTNTSFFIFRYDLSNLNFLPAGAMLTNVYKECVVDYNNVLFRDCEDLQSPESQSGGTSDKQGSQLPGSEVKQCSCEFQQDISLFSVVKGETKYERSNSIRSKSRSEPGGGDGLMWVEEDEDTARPLIAVVVSLCVSIFAVIALISGYMLMEIMTRRKHVRNTKIRPFVS